MRFLILGLSYYYLMVLILSVVGGIHNWKLSDAPLKLVTILLFSSIFPELLSIFFSFIGVKTAIHHHLFSILEIGLTISCYLALRENLSTRNIVLTFLAGIIVAWLNAHFLQSINEKNSYIISFTGIIFTILSCHSLYLIMINDNLRVLKDPLFWFWGMQLLDGFTSFLYWGLYEIAKGKYEDIFEIMNLLKVLFGDIIYSCLAYAMLMLPKLNKRTT